VRTHAEHLAHTLNPVPLFERVGHCVPVGKDDKIYGAAHTRGLDVKKAHECLFHYPQNKTKSERFDLLLYKIKRYINSIHYYYITPLKSL